MKRIHNQNFHVHLSSWPRINHDFIPLRSWVHVDGRRFMGVSPDQSRNKMRNPELLSSSNRGVQVWSVGSVVCMCDRRKG
jgi:hypothetical protein